MKKWKKVLCVVLGVLAALALLLGATVLLSSRHRSSPKNVKTYETTNPLIMQRTDISAHRSGAGIAPEETLMAFKNCVEQEDFAIDVFEFDLHITADGVLVLLHDDTLDRTSDCTAVFGETDVRPEEKTYEELRRLNMGAQFVNDAGEKPYAGLSGDQVPDELRILRLEDVLDYLCANGDYKFIIEIKNSGELGKQGVDLLHAVLVERDLLSRVAFGTFHEDISRYVDETYPDLQRSTSIKEVARFWLAALTNSSNYTPPCSVLQIPFCAPYLNYGVNLGTTTVINYAHAHDMAVQYWTINDPEDMAYLASIGADCIMTDYPDILYQVLNGDL